MRWLTSIIAVAVLVTSYSAPTAFAHEKYYRTVDSAACETPALIKVIRNKFRTQARRVHHQPDWQIEALIDVHQHRYIPQDVHGERAVARRYCHATAVFNNGEHRAIWYLIEGGVGFAGFGRSILGSTEPVQKLFGNGGVIHNVEFCVQGLDRWNVYNGHCRLLR